MNRTAAIIFALLVAPVASGSSITTPACVVSGSNVVIGFDNDNAQERDWIGLLPETAVASHILPNPHDSNWIWTCGSQDCTSSPDHDSITIYTPNLNGPSKWIAVLARDNGGPNPQELLATSAVFHVRESCPEQTSALTTRSLATNATVVTDKTSYAVDEQFTVTFSIPDAIAGDWIGIFDAGTSIANQDSFHFWLWAGCDRQGPLGSCQSSNTGAVVFEDNKDIAWESSTWPLDPGRYVAAIIRNSDSAPFTPLAVSPAFRIRMPAISSELIAIVREDFAQLIYADGDLAAPFLRLGFHDSIGGPDGCVDLTNIRNTGLKEPIDALAPIVTKYKASLSRADIWALAAMVGSQVSQPKDAAFKVNFDFTEFGRINCEKQQSVCLNQAGVSHGCSATRGPHRDIPGSKFNTHELFAFFNTNYGFSTRETVAIMGGHTIGELSRNNTGIDGPNGFVTRNRILDNEYYAELVGDAGNLAQGAPIWKQHFEDNSDSSKFDDIYVWRRPPAALNGSFIVMTDADIAIVRDLNGINLNPQTGQVNCQFENRAGNQPTCPQLNGALDEAARYKFSNRSWLIDFEAALRKLLNVGYSITSDCMGDLCKLTKQAPLAGI